MAKGKRTVKEEAKLLKGLLDRISKFKPVRDKLNWYMSCTSSALLGAKPGRLHLHYNTPEDYTKEPHRYAFFNGDIRGVLEVNQLGVVNFVLGMPWMRIPQYRYNTSQGEWTMCGIFVDDPEFVQDFPSSAYVVNKEILHKIRTLVPKVTYAGCKLESPPKSILFAGPQEFLLQTVKALAVLQDVTNDVSVMQENRIRDLQKYEDAAERGRLDLVNSIGIALGLTSDAQKPLLEFRKETLDRIQAELKTTSPPPSTPSPPRGCPFGWQK